MSLNFCSQLTRLNQNKISFLKKSSKLISLLELESPPVLFINQNFPQTSVTFVNQILQKQIGSQMQNILNIVTLQINDVCVKIFNDGFNDFVVHAWKVNCVARAEIWLLFKHGSKKRTAGHQDQFVGPLALKIKKIANNILNLKS